VACTGKNPLARMPDGGVVPSAIFSWLMGYAATLLLRPLTVIVPSCVRYCGSAGAQPA